jgi:hypothetical protein
MERWNNGVMEYWERGAKVFPISSFHYSNTPLLHFLATPTLHYSNSLLLLFESRKYLCRIGVKNLVFILRF